MKPVVTIVTVVCIGGASFLLRNPTVTESSSGSRHGPSLVRSAQKLARPSLKVSAADTRSATGKPLSRMSLQIRHFLAEANTVQGAAKRRAVLELWANDPEILHVVDRLLVTGERLGLDRKTQAELRYFGIKMYEYQARLDSGARLTATFRRLLDESPSTISHGREHDIADLFAVLIRTRLSESQDLVSDISALLAEVGYEYVKEASIRQLIDDELFIYLYPAIGRPQTKRMLDGLLGSVN